MILKRLVFVLLAFIIMMPQPVLAEYFFNPHYVISDEEMVEYDSLSLIQIQRFLEEQGSGLARGYFTDYTGSVKKASVIIWQAAQESRINPKVILATLQKEQSLINDISPSQKRLDRAMGYRCPDGGSCADATLDFGKQVDGATWQFRQYLDYPEKWNYKKGQRYDVDGIWVEPVNTATAGLYNYTPHIHGNNRFWTIWQEYWGKNYPDGSLVKTSNSPAVWFIQYGQRRLITSWSVLLSRFDPKKILSISQTDLEKYEEGPAIKFSNYSLLQSPSGKIYLVDGDEIRHITSAEVFRVIGFNFEEVEPAEDIDLNAYSVGSPITVETVYPTGALLQDKLTGGVYYVRDGIKKPVYSAEILKAKFPNRLITQVSIEQLSQYRDGLPVKFNDGELIKAEGDSKIYVVSDGKRRWLKSEETFDKFSYKWDNVIVTNRKALEAHPLDEDIE